MIFFRNLLTKIISNIENITFILRFQLSNASCIAENYAWSDRSDVLLNQDCTFASVSI